MALALFTFTLTLTIVLAAYWSLVLRPETRAAAQLRGRLQLKVIGPPSASSLIKPGGAGQARFRAFAWLGRLAIAPTAALIERAGVRLNARRTVVLTMSAAALMMALLLLAHAHVGVALGIGLLMPLVPFAYLSHAADRRLAAFEEAFPEAIDLMARALRAGHALTAALAMIAEEIGEPVRSEFRLLYEQQNYGLPLPQVLKTFAARVPLTDVRLFVTAVLTQRETGGNLAEILDNLASVTRDRFRVRRQLRVLTAQGRMTGWILAGFPLVLTFVLYLVNPNHLKAFLEDPLGVQMLQIAAVLQVVGTVLIRRIVAVDY